MNYIFKFLFYLLVLCAIFISCSNFLKASKKQEVNLVFLADGGTYTQPYYRGERKPFNIYFYIEKFLNKNLSYEDKKMYHQNKDTFLLRFHVDNINQISYIICDEKVSICSNFKECLDLMATDSSFLKSNTNHITNHEYKIYVIDKNNY